MWLRQIRLGVGNEKNPSSLLCLGCFANVFKETKTGAYLSNGCDSHRSPVVLAVQVCSPLCDPMDCRMPGFSVCGILQARILEWVFFPSSGGHPNPGTEPRSLVPQADSLPPEPPGKQVIISKKVRGLPWWSRFNP